MALGVGGGTVTGPSTVVVVAALLVETVMPYYRRDKCKINFVTSIGHLKRQGHTGSACSRVNVSSNRRRRVQTRACLSSVPEMKC